LDQVIVGFNGSGKSTILKLAARIYDATEGTIRVNGRDIRELKLDDLRRSVAVLFQDYTLFPVSVSLSFSLSFNNFCLNPFEHLPDKVKDNIALGNPKYATDLKLIHEAARLGGADSVIRRLPDKLNTYISRPDSVHDVIRIQRDDHSGDIDHALRELTGAKPPQGLSGGQLQRIAV
jgi:ABC-type multidrug transport system fused ATPase/permease subunit